MFPAIQIVARQYGMSGPRQSPWQRAENILTAHPDLNGLFASTEPQRHRNASLALKERELGGKIKFVGFDFSDGMIADLKSGVMDAFVAQDPFQIGYRAVQTLADRLHGKTPPRVMDLSGRVITRENLDAPEAEGAAVSPI